MGDKSSTHVIAIVNISHCQWLSSSHAHTQLVIRCTLPTYVNEKILWTIYYSDDRITAFRPTRSAGQCTAWIRRISTKMLPPETIKTSRDVPHPSTALALARLTSNAWSIQTPTKLMLCEFFSIPGSWTRVFQVNAEYPKQLDYNRFPLITSLNLWSFAKQICLEWVIKL